MSAVNVVKKEVPKVQKKLVKAGSGKFTVDSGAAESVMPKAMLGNETLVAGAAKLAGVKYVAANGARMDNHGEKQVRFKCQEGGSLEQDHLAGDGCREAAGFGEPDPGQGEHGGVQQD